MTDTLPKCVICNQPVDMSIDGITVNSNGNHWHGYCYKAQETIDQYKAKWDECVDRLNTRAAPKVKPLDDVIRLLDAEVQRLRIALSEIAGATLTETRHFTGPSPEDEVDATVLALDAEYLQDIAAEAIKGLDAS